MSEQVSTGRRVFGISIFLFFAVVCVTMALVEDAVSMYAFAFLFLWLAVFAVAKDRSEQVRVLVETIGGVVLAVVGALAILDRENLREMAVPGRDRSFVLVYILAPLLVVGGLFYALRNIARRRWRDGASPADRDTEGGPASLR